MGTTQTGENPMHDNTQNQAGVYMLNNADNVARIATNRTMQRMVEFLLYRKDDLCAPELIPFYVGF